MQSSLLLCYEVVGLMSEFLHVFLVTAKGGGDFEWAAKESEGASGRLLCNLEH